MENLSAEACLCFKSLAWSCASEQAFFAYEGLEALLHQATKNLLRVHPDTRQFSGRHPCRPAREFEPCDNYFSHWRFAKISAGFSLPSFLQSALLNYPPP